VQTFRLLRRFFRYMPVRDVVYLIIKPFLGKGQGATQAEVLSRAVEHGALKDEAARLTQMTDDMLEQVIRESRAERLRLQEEAESRRELPMVASR
jgi:predicted small metal-binding protein